MLIPGVVFIKWKYNGCGSISISDDISLRKKHSKVFPLQFLSFIRYPNGLSENRGCWGLDFKKLFHSENTRTPNVTSSSLFKDKDSLPFYHRKSNTV